MNYQDLNDYELLYLVEEQNEDANYLLYEKYIPMIKQIVYNSYINLKKYGVNYDDIYQEAMLAFFTAVELFDNKEGTLFYTFMNITVRSKLANFARKIFTHKNLPSIISLSLNSPVSSDDDDTLLDKIVAKDDSIENQLVYGEVLERLRQFKFQLSFKNSQIFELLCNGFSNKEISILLDMELKQTSNTMYRIRKKLKKYLESFQN